MRPIVKRLAAAAAAVAVLAALAYPKLAPGDDEAAPPPAARGGGALSVSAYVVRPQALDNAIRATGTLRANESVALSSETSGRVTAILFEEGRRVGQGQVLVKINDTELQAQRTRAEARLRLAAERERRQRQILDGGGISQEEYDLVRTEVDVLRSELALIDAQIAKTEIRAPFAGLIGLRYVSEGAYLTPQTPIATLQSLDPLKVDFAVPERYANLVGAGDVIVFRVQGTDTPHRGTIYAVEPGVAEDTRTLQLRARTPNPGGALLPGAFADVEVALETYDDALLIPTTAVVPELGGQKVFVVELGRAVPRQVTTGIRTATDVQILDGLAPGDTVLTSGLQQVRPGLQVDVRVD